MKSFSESYKAAGVDVTAGYKSVELMKQHVARTKIDGVVSGIGGFGGLFAPNVSGMTEPVLVSGTDGVGTKIKLAFLMDKHDTIGIDAVAMCVNDVICCGAKPLFFLDYIAIGKNYPEKVAEIVKGVADGCVMSECALIGGETAEHPGLMPVDEYDVAGFCVGLADKPLDELDPIESAYCLEVCSPGLERELVRDEHFMQFIGADIKVKMLRPIEGIGREFGGVLDAYDNGEVTISDHDGENHITINKKDASWIKLDDFDM